MEDLDVVKIGGSVLFDKKGEFRTNTIDNIFKKLSSYSKDKIIVTGCGELLHNFATKYELINTPKVYNLEERAKGAKEMKKVVLDRVLDLEEMAKPYMKVLSFIPSDLFEKESHGRKDSHEIVEFKKDFLDGTLELGTPLVSGGIVPDRTLGYSTISSDTIAAYLGTVYNANRILLLTDVDGVYEPKSREELLREVRASDYANFEGGMKNKLRRVKFATSKRKIYIANGNNIKNLEKILSEDKGKFTRVL